MQTSRVGLGWTESVMAENETLDLRRSARWSQARRLISDGAPPRVVADEVLRCVRAIFKRVRKLIPFSSLVKEVLDPMGRPRLRRRECLKAWDYAEFIQGLRGVYRDQIDLLHALAEHVVDEFFHQERMRLELHPDGSGFHSFERFRESVNENLHHDLWALARVEADANERPDSRRVPASLPRESPEDLLQISLRGH